MQCVILAGGLGTRMREVAAGLPKSLIPVLGRPFVDHQLEWLAAQGVDDVVLSIGYRGDLIREHLGRGAGIGLGVRYVDEGEQLCGTGGALRLALDEGVLDEAFLVLYGDSYLSVDVEAVWAAFARSGCPALLTVYRNEGRWDTSNATFANGRVLLYEKQRTQREAADLAWIDYGLSALSRGVLGRLPRSRTSDLADLYHELSLEGLLAGFEAKERFYEVGSSQGLADLEQYLSGRWLPSAPSLRTDGRSSSCGSDSRSY
jgi:MurNAc alpha-1-phosphate uridylyltransferase